VVGLLLLRSADVTRYRLPDQRISPSPHSFSADWSIPTRSSRLFEAARADCRHAAPSTERVIPRNRPALFHRLFAGLGE
jgi:hypothetical protein